MSNLVILETKGRGFWKPVISEDGAKWIETNIPPHFGSIQAHSTIMSVGYHWKKHAVLFSIMGTLRGYDIFINAWSLTTDTCTPRLIRVRLEGQPLGWLSKEESLRYLKRWLLSEGLYTVAGYPPRTRKMIYQMLEEIKDDHVTTYYPGYLYRLSKHHGRWRLSHDGKVCLDVNHLNQITQANLYHLAV
ncbi:hypothetical protein PQC06_gp127 [Aeromonas phage LAh10]|uniref:Uncharacterized protein n=1 Tax=Aeromonas phage LAh10 TaxID=2591025 RepID=A0A514A1Q2_9CAUD|nr:hypothetical protein PQC06_gp127 [Aeromonas phage LAh10]QDH47152.1 hypothetical protein LAh10_127 [Aeromonas phage LAh10]